MVIHTVTADENWFDISEKYDLSIDYLKKLNSITYDDLAVGEEILVAYPKIEYYAAQGDTLDGIARTYGTTVVQLLRNNPYLGSGLKIGDRVIVDFEEKRRRPIILSGYCYTFINRELFVSVLPYLSFITVFTYGFTEDGRLVLPRPSDDYFVQTAREYGTVPLMHLSTLTENGNFSNELAAELLNNRKIWQTLIENIMTNVREKNYGGVDIDFEYLPPQNRVDYAEFVGMLKKALNDEGYYLVTALAPKVSADQQGLLYEGHDYALLGENSNLVLLMTYEWGYAYSEPMAVAPVQSVERVVRYGVSEIPSDKILLGLPFYGYDWQLPYVKGVTVGRSLAVDKAVELARQYNGEIIFDEASGSPYLKYFDDGNEHIVWFESPKSIEMKMDIADRYSLSGGGIWNIDRPFYRGLMLINLLYDIERF